MKQDDFELRELADNGWSYDSASVSLSYKRFLSAWLVLFLEQPRFLSTLLLLVREGSAS